jgi:hypothetical protein
MQTDARGAWRAPAAALPRVWRLASLEQTAAAGTGAPPGGGGARLFSAPQCGGLGGGRVRRQLRLKTFGSRLEAEAFSGLCTLFPPILTCSFLALYP